MCASSKVELVPVELSFIVERVTLLHKLWRIRDYLRAMLYQTILRLVFGSLL